MGKYPNLQTGGERLIRAQDPFLSGFVIANPAERKEPPPNKPPIKSPKKPKKPIGDPPPNRKIKSNSLKPVGIQSANF
jgi:hypothetical protein